MASVLRPCLLGEEAAARTFSALEEAGARGLSGGSPMLAGQERLFITWIMVGI